MLTPDRWELVERIFHEALSLPPDQRAAFVGQHCAGDSELQSEVTSLLAADSQADESHEALAQHAAADWAGLSAPPILGRTVGVYQVKSLLGVGGMGETYLAEDSALGRRVALKFLPRAFGSDARRVRRFIDEARAASALNHPGILTVYGAGEFEGQRYIAAEFIDGQTVRERLGEGPLPQAAALDIAIQATEALGVAHQAGIIHRDIKPENIMIRPDGYVKIIDFGLAKPVESGDAQAARASRVGDVVGTSDYMAPEQAAGASVDARSDLYSLCVVLYEMLTGELPRDLDSHSSRGGSRKSGIHVSPPALRAIRRGLARDPAGRYQSAAGLQRELEQLRQRASRPSRRWRWPAIAAVAASLAFGAYRWNVTRRPSGEIRSLLVMPLRSLGDTDQSHLEEGMSEALITRLGALPKLRVPPAAAIKPNEDPFDAARRLHVEAVLTGSVQRLGERLRVTAHLSRVADHGQIWAAQYDQVFTGIFDIQDAIAERVAENLVSEVSPSDRALLTRHESRSSAAYDLYLRAREQWALRTPPTIRTAIKMYQQAISIEPNFALAYAGLADSYNLAVSGLPPSTRAPLARAAAERALALDPQSAEAHTAMAFLEYKFEWKWEDADREFRKAIVLNPRYALAHHWYGEFLKLINRHDDSIREFRQAVEADPFSIPIRYDFILSLLNAQKVAEARTVLNETVAIDPTAQRVLRAQSEVLAAEGRIDESVELGFRAQLLAGMATAPLGMSEKEIRVLRAAYAAGGLPAMTRRQRDLLLAKLQPGSEPAFHLASDLADVYARLGDRDHTLLWLRKAVDLHEDEALLMMTRRFDFLRRDAEMIALEKRVGFLR